MRSNWPGVASAGPYLYAGLSITASASHACAWSIDVGISMSKMRWYRASAVQPGEAMTAERDDGTGGVQGFGPVFSLSLCGCFARNNPLPLICRSPIFSSIGLLQVIWSSSVGFVNCGGGAAIIR